MTEANKHHSATQWRIRRDRWIKQVLRQNDLSGQCQIVGMYLAMEMSHDQPWCSLQQSAIADALNIHVVTVKRAIKSLVEAGMLEKGNNARGRANQPANRYALRW